MQRTSQLLCDIAIILLAGTVVSPSYAQSVPTRALFAYPMQGQTPEQENADRAACHDWAVAQSGFDPTPVYASRDADKYHHFGATGRLFSILRTSMLSSRRHRRCAR